MTTHTSNKKAMHGEDRISNLPDAILTHLLSFVSTREAVRTSTLSSRWKSVWPLVPTLDLSEMHFYMEIFKNDDNHRAKSQASFLNFLDRALLACTMPYIETITIRGQSLHESSHVKTWICAAIERNIRELVLIVDCESKKPLDELPQALFSNSKLVVLKLRLKMVVDFPETSVCFPNLKVLELHKVNYKDDNSAQNLISSCPVLQDLVIGRGYSDNLQTLNVISHVLKNLKVTCREGFEDHVKELVIDAPALESIDFFDCVTQEYELVTDLPYISKAKLHVSNSFSAFRDEESFETCLTELLEKICNVKFLSFSSYTMLSLSHTESYDLPKFQNLTCFELYTRTKVKRISWDLMMEILDCSPILETLIFQGLEFSWDGKTRALHWDVPSCLLSSLKTIKIMGLHRAFDLRKITYFLENAKVLEKLIIDNGRWDEGFKLEIAEKLSKARKASMACQFLLC